MRSRLQEQRVGDDGTDRGNCQRARHHVFRTVQQNPQQQATLDVGFNRNRFGTTPAAWGVVILGNSLRHFSSPEEVDPFVPVAAPA